MDEEILGTAYVNEDMPEDDKVPEDMEKEDNINTIEKNTIEKNTVEKNMTEKEAWERKTSDEEMSDNATTEETTAETLEEALEDAVSEKELNKLKSWLFKENVRIISAAKELEQMQEQFREEKEQFREEMKALNRRMAAERQRLKDDNLFFEKKMEILKGGFTELDMDRRRLEKEWARLEAQKEVMQQPVYSSGRDVSDLFQGVKNPLALKKRYKDLIKIFHPDNVAGDKEMIQKINIEYENLRHDFDIGRWA